jgi:phosphopantetheine--protein transferase-like protein
MIKGMGIDIVDIKRIAQLIEKYGEQFLKKVFTQKEIAWCDEKAMPAVHFAGRWAAKEAFYKALPDICQPHSFWKSIEILPTQTNNRPVITICAEELDLVLKENGISFCHLSISHEHEICTAMVIME